MLSANSLTGFIESMFTARFLEFAAESVGELGTVISQNLLNMDWAVFMHLLKKINAAVLALIRINLDKHPACSAINGREQITPLIFIGHLWQILDIYV